MTKTDSDVPQPGPARLSKGAGPDEWLAAAKECKYLPEADMKRLCEIVKECLMEGESHRLFGAVKCGTEDTAYSDGERILLTQPFRVQHPTRPNPCYNLRRYPWPILRPTRAVSSGWRNA